MEEIYIFIFESGKKSGLLEFIKESLELLDLFVEKLLVHLFGIKYGTSMPILGLSDNASNDNIDVYNKRCNMINY